MRIIIETDDALDDEIYDAFTPDDRTPEAVALIFRQSIGGKLAQNRTRRAAEDAATELGESLGVNLLAGAPPPVRPSRAAQRRAQRDAEQPTR